MPRLLLKGGKKKEMSPLKYPFGSQVWSAINGGVNGFVSGTERFGERFHAKGSSVLQCSCQAILNVTAVFLFISFF